MHLFGERWLERPLQSVDIQFIYSEFLSRVHLVINTTLPCKSVTIGPHDPEYITPLVKLLLKQRWQFLKTAHIDKANDLSVQINSLINMHCSSRLNNMKDATSKELWAAVKPAISSTCRLDYSADVTNQYFSMTSNDDFNYSTAPFFDIFTHQYTNSPIY